MADLLGFPRNLILSWSRVLSQAVSDRAPVSTRRLRLDPVDRAGEEIATLGLLMAVLADPHFRDPPVLIHEPDDAARRVPLADPVGRVRQDVAVESPVSSHGRRLSCANVWSQANFS
jgi:hypothetical protein